MISTSLPSARFGARLLALLIGLWIGPSLAADPPPAAGSADDLEKLVGTLQNDQQRQHLITDLQALIAAQRHESAPPPTVPADLIDAATERLQQIGDDLVDTAGVLIDLPDLAAWAEAEIEDEHSRNRWLAIGRHVLSILGAAILADLVGTLVARRLRRPLVRPAGPSRAARSIRLLSLLAVDALPIAAFALVGYAMTSIVQPKIITAHVSSVAITAIFTVRVLQVLARTLLLSPRETGWTLLPLGAETSNYLYIWVRRFLFWAIYGFAFCAAVWWLGVPGSVYAVLLKAMALVLTILGIVFTLQNRHAVAHWLRPRPPARMDEAEASLADPVAAEPPPPSRAVDLVRHRVADFWHVLVIVYLAGIFAVYALRIQNGFSYVFRATLLSIAILVAAKLLNRLITRLTEHGFAVHQELKQQFPTLEKRANRYVPILTMVASGLVWAVALLSLLESWGVSSFSWIATDAGRRTAGSLFAVIIILALALLVWEVFNTAIDRYLAGVTGNGDRIARSARMRTLLPLLRNVLFVLLLVVVGLVVLSEVGVNIAPLLGVSAVAGVAIGFGSQALVKDIITGLFILVEDTMAVGDVVDFGGGFAGNVEGMSIRTIKLRDGQGTLQVIPFGEVTKIKNLSRDFAYHVIDLMLPFTTDTDAVSRILTEIGTEMSADPTIGPMMAAPIEIIGLVGAGLEGLKLEARIKTRPLKQWAVQRDFNRRLKRAFDAAGITPPGTGQTISFDPKVMELIERFGPARGAMVEKDA